VVIFIAIHPVELQPFRDFGSEEDIAPASKEGTALTPSSCKQNQEIPQKKTKKATSAL
jgi:hypothetical protein